MKSRKPVRLILFGDVHRDAPAHALEKWKSDLDYWRSLKDVYFLGMGDYLDSTSTTERECLGNISGKMHETFRDDIQALQLAKVELMAKELSFMRGRIVGLLGGNHYFEFQSGMTSDHELCKLLSAKYLGVCSFVRLTFDYHGRRISRDIFAHHGMGASRLVGGSLNRVAQMFEGAEADITIMGHDHNRGAVPGVPRMFLAHDARSSGLLLKQRDTWIVRSGSYLKSHQPGKADYNVDSQRMPRSLGHVELQFTYTHTRKGDDTVDIKSLV